MYSRTTRAAFVFLSTSWTVYSFAILPHQKTTTTSLFGTLSSSSSLEPSAEDFSNGRRTSEFDDLEPLDIPHMRRQRMELDEENKKQFVEYGNDLWDLRATMLDLSSKLIETVTSGEEEIHVRQELRRAESQDPELVYELQLEAIEEASKKGDLEQVQQHKSLAMAARSCLPQFNLEGLWVGKYGKHGYEMINVTYIGDTLKAVKVTGDKNVPRGEITFQADLSPPKELPASLRLEDGGSDQKRERLEPITLTDTAAKKWGTKQLVRHAGLGQVAEDGHNNNQWMEGQLIVIGNEYFSFAWVPIEHQIFFGRPSPELVLKMLKDGGSSEVNRSVRGWDGEAPPTMDADDHVLREYAHHILQVTSETIEDEFDGVAPVGCIYYDGDEADECFFQ